MTTRYYLAVDTATQWFPCIVKLEVSDDGKASKTIERIDLPAAIHILPGPPEARFLSNIYRRHGQAIPEIDWSHGEAWGHSISDWEYDRIKRMIELWPLVQEFNELSKYKV